MARHQDCRRWRIQVLGPRLVIAFSACLVFAGLVTAPGVELGEAIPDSQSVSHPGSEAAPVSSPLTYPDADGFGCRADVILSGVAEGSLETWRTGYFGGGGDPGKYLPGHAMAKLLLGRDESEVRRYMNDDRSYKEHYHFAAVNWARFYPLFGERILTETTQGNLVQAAKTYSGYLTPGGTENHKAMWMTSANVLPHYLGVGLANRSKSDTLAKAKKMLRDYVKGLYSVGQGEWDSSIYLTFDINGMLNVYDFAKDPEVRLLAKAALDWYAATYALKYRDGIFTAPNQRGFPKAAHDSLTDQIGYLWFGSSAEITSNKTGDWRYTLHAITSGYRPNKVIHDLANKDLPDLPETFRNTKPNYWYGRGIKPQQGNYAETVHTGRDHTLASLWNGSGGQITRWQLVGGTDQGGVMLHGGHPRRSDHTGKKVGLGLGYGKGRYDRAAQVGGTLINMTKAPEAEPIDWSFVSLPKRIDERERVGTWWVLRIGKTYVGIRPIRGGMKLATVGFDDEERQRVLKIPGRRNGFIIETADVEEYAGVAELKEALRDTKLEKTGFAKDMAITYTNLKGKAMAMRYAPDRKYAEMTVDGKPINPGDWDWVYQGPYIKQEDGLLTVSNGKKSFTVDFSGGMPVYR